MAIEVAPYDRRSFDWFPARWKREDESQHKENNHRYDHEEIGKRDLDNSPMHEVGAAGQQAGGVHHDDSVVACLVAKVMMAPGVLRHVVSPSETLLLPSTSVQCARAQEMGPSALMMREFRALLTHPWVGERA